MAFQEKGKGIFTTKTPKITKGKLLGWGQKAAPSKPQPLPFGAWAAFIYPKPAALGSS